MRLLQVCNVGNVVGGTAACAWTVTRAFPDVDHTVSFLSKVTEQTGRAFAHCRVEQWQAVTEDQVSRADPDVVLLHNVSANRCGPFRVPVVVQYVHSRGARAGADVTVYCSRWLAGACGTEDPSRVMYQAVPKPIRPESGATRSLRDRLVIGRLCTPSAGKWPDAVVDLYVRLARRFGSVSWEFVGCPRSLEGRLEEACRGRASFYPAGWQARRRLWLWDGMLYHHPQLTESFGRTVAESMRAGCAPIVDARGGFTEQVPAGCGFLCSDETEFEAALDQLHQKNAKRRMSRAAMAHADRAFSLDRFRRDFLLLLGRCTV